jgi:nitrogen-specific signal transduction histidine kinase
MDERASRGILSAVPQRVPGGTGLGAAIVYRLVEEHGVNQLDSARAGTTIHIFVPQVREGAMVAVDASHETAGGIPA